MSTLAGTESPERAPEVIDADIATMLKGAPIGSAGYTDPAFQEKLQALYAERHPRPIVGARMRTV